MSYNKDKGKNESNESSWELSNPHDRCCRATAFNETYAPDFLKNYGGPVLNECVDLDHLKQAPTVQLNKELKEFNLDASLTTRLSDENNQMEILLHLEHKSQPSTASLIQLLMGAVLTIYLRWEKAGRPEKGFVPPMILMIIVYNGPDDWVDELSFLDFFKNLPPGFERYLIQFHPIVINLRRFDYDNLPGELHTQAYVESLMRGTDGTLAEHFPQIMEKLACSNLPESGQNDLAYTLSVYSASTTEMNSQQIIDAISTAFKEQQVNKMAGIFKDKFFQEGFAIGEKRGEKRGIEIGIEKGIEIGETRKSAEAIIKVLRTRFKRVPSDVSKTIRQMNDATALDSLLVFAVTCASIKDFADSLK